MATKPFRTEAASTAWLLRMALFACLVSMAGISGCRRHEPPEQRLRRDIAALQAAIEARDAGKVADFLSDDFIGTGGLDRERARRFAALHFMRNRDVGVTLGPVDVSVQGGHATARCSALLTGGSGGLLPDAGGAYRVTSGWRLEQGDWRMTSLDWERE